MSEQSSLVEFEGELFSSTWLMKWIETGNEIAAGVLIAPVPLEQTSEAIEYAALSLAADDLRLAQVSFAEAYKLGMPSSANVLSKALIHAAIMSYARSFTGGVRGFRLDAKFFSPIWDAVDVELHDYLYNLRDKHVAHSVNDFERATAVGVVVADQSFRLLNTNPSGVGVVKMSMVGLPLSKLKLCRSHIERMVAHIDQRAANLELMIHRQMRAGLTVGEMVEVAPILITPDRSKIAERRR
ncbi:hypothetical protein [Caulobacter vibrioides]|nr:hypothetical protein [Caulobacter vibrioides]YP_002517750.2 hypothetical protein CCNA_02377 [Caulobacter vibrioides NA1000]ACL95842.2 hypothetical protein CCNA_02377 [Caulobacter vibrioides NA1000]QXZ50666.1 hypothetical protein KZH45_12210 [Caulobacter vibrioides]